MTTCTGSELIISSNRPFFTKARKNLHPVSFGSTRRGCRQPNTHLRHQHLRRGCLLHRRARRRTGRARQSRGLLTGSQAGAHISGVRSVSCASWPRRAWFGRWVCVAQEVVDVGDARRNRRARRRRDRICSLSNATGRLGLSVGANWHGRPLKNRRDRIHCSTPGMPHPSQFRAQSPRWSGRIALADVDGVSSSARSQGAA